MNRCGSSRNCLANQGTTEDRTCALLRGKGAGRGVSPIFKAGDDAFHLIRRGGQAITQLEEAEEELARIKKDDFGNSKKVQTNSVIGHPVEKLVEYAKATSMDPNSQPLAKEFGLYLAKLNQRTAASAMSWR